MNLNTRELLGRIMTGKGENMNQTVSSSGGMMGSTPVTDRLSGSTTESAEINFLEAVPAIDR